MTLAKRLRFTTHQLSPGFRLALVHRLGIAGGISRGAALAGYSSLMQNLNLTWAQDLGSVTELLSGEFFQPLGRSSSHQLWSSAMVVSPLLRGLFGVDWDANSKTVEVNPHLPAEWDESQVTQLTARNNEPGFRNGSACWSAACASRNKTAREVVHCHAAPYPRQVRIRNIGSAYRHVAFTPN